jgi:hypothetical protein
MATSPIYNWPEPDNTDLVKNGALAIRTLGNAIDTTMGTMVAKTIIDAKGDLIAGTAADTASRIAVGSNGQVLTADSTSATGLAWATASSGYSDNGVINSAFQVWQRGTSFSSPVTGTFTADRFNSINTGTAATTISRQTTGDTTNLPFIQYCLRYARNSGQTNTGNLYITYGMENIDSTRFVGKTVTLSFYARKGANYSPTSSLLQVRGVSGTGTDQNINNGFTGGIDFISSTATLTTTWQRFTYTATVSSSATQLGFYVYSQPTGTAGAADYYEITGFQFEASSAATAFHTNQPSIATELAACQRYYFRFGGDVVYQTLGFGTANATTTAAIMVTNPIPMRVAPTSVDFSTLALQTQQTGTVNALTTLTIATNQNGKNAVILNAGGSGGLTAGSPQVLLSNNSLSGYLGLSAEL